MPDARDPYAARFRDHVRRYESVSFERVHAAWLHLLADSGGRALDVGAGSGRDAAALTERGYDVVAVEPSRAMREEARRRHRSPRIRWIDDALPELARLTRPGPGFDLVLASAVWQHLARTSRERGLRRLAELVRPGGLLAITLRLGAADRERAMHPVDVDDLLGMAQRAALAPVEIEATQSPDPYDRPQIRWVTRVFSR